MYRNVGIFYFEIVQKKSIHFDTDGERGKAMAIYGYHRTSTKVQHLDRGIYEITKFCKEHGLELTDIFTDQLTGKDFARPEYQFLKKRIQPGDVLIITELDRLGRNKKGILEELMYFRERGVRVMILELPTTLIDVSSFNNELAKMMMETINNLMIELYASIAQAEMEKKEKRQKEGIEQKKARGEWENYGRPAVMKQTDFDQAFLSVLSGAMKPTELQKELGMSHATFYRYRKKYLEKFQKSEKV